MRPIDPHDPVLFESASPEPNTGCWLWTAGVDIDGYGGVKRLGKSMRAHRLAWEIANRQPVPNGLVICHRCDNPTCINPDHLFVGTDLDNVHDRDAKGRTRAPGGEAHYLRRHPELRPRGERHGRVKLTEAQALEVLRRCGAGQSQASVARDLGVSKSAINLIVLGRNWAHLPRPSRAA